VRRTFSAIAASQAPSQRYARAIAPQKCVGSVVAGSLATESVVAELDNAVRESCVDGT